MALVQSSVRGSAAARRVAQAYGQQSPLRSKKPAGWANKKGSRLSAAHALEASSRAALEWVAREAAAEGELQLASRALLEK